MQVSFAFCGISYEKMCFAVGKRFPGAPRGAARGGRLNPNVGKSTNPFQLTTATSNDAQQQQSGSLFSSAPQTSNPSPFTAQPEHFKSSGNKFSSNDNPFIASSTAFSQSSFSAASVTGASFGGRPYLQQTSKIGGRNLSDPRQERTSTFTSSRPDNDMQDSQPEKRNTFQNPFAKPSSLKFQSSKQAGAQGKMHAGASRLHRPVLSTAHHYVVTLSVRNIDQHMCTPEILNSHFQQFGDVCDLKCMPRKGMATVSYRDHVRTYS